MELKFTPHLETRDNWNSRKTTELGASRIITCTTKDNYILQMDVQNRESKNKRLHSLLVEL